MPPTLGRARKPETLLFFSQRGGATPTAPPPPPNAIKIHPHVSYCPQVHDTTSSLCIVKHL